MALAWEGRTAGNPLDPSVAEAMALVASAPPGKPVVLVEPSDNVGAGTHADGTGALGELLSRDFTGILATLKDPQAVLACQAAGVGAQVTLQMGGKTDAFHGAPLTVTGTVRHLSDGQFSLEDPHSHLASMIGLRAKMGNSAVLVNERLTLLLTSEKIAPMDLGQYRSQGINPEDAKVIVVKAAVAHRQAYRPIWSREVAIDTPGLGTSTLTRLPYRHVRHPLYPLDA